MIGGSTMGLIRTEGLQKPSKNDGRNLGLAHKTNVLDKFKQNVQFKSFAWCYDKFFDVIKADTPELREQVYNIRHQVYCDEYGFESARTGKKIEHDAYDENSCHALLIHKKQDRPVGTVRIVLPNQKNLLKSFPLQEIFAPGRLKDELNVQSMCEISRLCILKDFRRRSTDHQLISGVQPQDEQSRVDVLGNKISRRVVPFGPIGLLKACMEMSVDKGCDRACAIMEPRLIKSLERLGIICERLGPAMEYKGLRQPVLIDYYSASNHMRLNQKAVWDVMTSHGALHEKVVRVRKEKEDQLTIN